jgi:hypothetical protein
MSEIQDAIARLNESTDSLDPVAHVKKLQAKLAEVEAERDAYKRDFGAELDGNAAMRTRLGARESETMFAFVDRLAAEQERDTEVEPFKFCPYCGHPLQVQR